MAKCCICGRPVEEDAAILTMGAAGNARYLCEECDELLITATTSRDFEEIESAMGEISNRISNYNPDGVTFDILSYTMLSASERAKQIKNGTYDFTLDETEDDGYELEDIPEELLETEEDRELDRVDEEKMKKFDKVYNIIMIVAIIAIVGMIIWRLIDTFLLK